MNPKFMYTTNDNKQSGMDWEESSVPEEYVLHTDSCNLGSDFQSPKHETEQV